MQTVPANQQLCQQFDGAAATCCKTVALVYTAVDVVHDPVCKLAWHSWQIPLRRGCTRSAATTEILSLLLSLRSKADTVYVERDRRC